MSVRSTLFKALWPETLDFLRMARDWSESASCEMLRYVWTGCDTLDRNVLQEVRRATSDLLNLERSISQLLVPEIDKAMPKASPFFVMHECFEFESQSQTVPNAQPPQYDIAFVLYSNQRIMWPIEAKVVPTDRTLGEYLKEIKGNFLTCRYAPFSAQGAMLAYLLAGKPSVLFENIEKRLNCVLSNPPDFSNRDHKTSDHQRSVPKDKNYPTHFRCHHLIFEVGPSHGPVATKS